MLATSTPAHAASTSKSGVTFTHVTVTASKARGNSAVSMTIENNSKDVISLYSITSSVTQSSMIDYDTNMCQGNHAMMKLPNILIYGGHSQHLGYKYQGAMLRQVRDKIIEGETIPIVISWTNFGSAHSVTVEAKVVAPPRYLNFGMSGMSGMSGMG
jgi:copper(I)-binding protein